MHGNVGYLLAELAAADRTHEPLLHITRPEAMNFASMAVHLSHQLAREVRYVDCTPSDLLRCAEAAGMQPWRAHDTVNWQTEASLHHCTDTFDAEAGIRRGQPVLTPEGPPTRRPASPLCPGSDGSASGAFRPRGSRRSHPRTIAASRAHDSGSRSWSGECARTGAGRAFPRDG